MSYKLNRRDFVKTASAVSLSPLWATSSSVFASGQQRLKIGVVGCGHRGRSALYETREVEKFLGVKTEIVALGDYFKEKVEFAAKEFDVPLERCSSGVNAYKEVIASDADIIYLTTPPVFRPKHFEAAVNAGKHTFIEKPIAVDPPGTRKMIELGQCAKSKKLSVVAGTQRRYQKDYRQTVDAVAQGAIGHLISGKIWWCMGEIWFKERKKEEADEDYLIRNWPNFIEMSGDHILEQHIHQIDIANWFIGRPPQSAMGFGGRARRRTGNQYDFFSVDFDYGNNVSVHSMARQITGCYDRIAEHFVGTEGSTWATGPGAGGFKKKVSTPKFTGHENPYVQELVELFESVINSNPVNDIKDVADSNMAAIMGRISAYTGQMVRWRDLVDQTANSPWYNLALSPTAEDFEKGKVVAPPDDVTPVPGRAT